MTNFCRWLFGIATVKTVPKSASSTGQTKLTSEMNQGDYHSGPYGYSPNTSYPETQYGSNFDEEADWNEVD
jgi:hypothetical protein